MTTEENIGTPTVAEMIEFIENLVPVWPEIGDCSTAATGEPYITFTIGGVLAEGESTPLLATSESAACKWFLDSFLRYALDKRGTLYWREKPNLQVQKTVPLSSLYGIWARLLISDKPVLGKEDGK